MVVIIVRGVDLDEDGNRWVMGDDVCLEASLEAILKSVVDRVRILKAIHASRVRVVIPPGHIIENLEINLKRVGINEKSNVIEIHPTTRGVWMWHPMEYYERQYKDELFRVLGDDKMDLTELIQKASKPPVLRMTTHVFLRKYPDFFVVETSLASNLSRVRKNSDNSNLLFY